jgi:hypothetical protein
MEVSDRCTLGEGVPCTQWIEGEGEGWVGPTVGVDAVDEIK